MNNDTLLQAIQIGTGLAFIALGGLWLIAGLR